MKAAKTLLLILVMFVCEYAVAGWPMVAMRLFGREAVKHFMQPWPDLSFEWQVVAVWAVVGAILMFPVLALIGFVQRILGLSVKAADGTARGRGRWPSGRVRR